MAQLPVDKEGKLYHLGLRVGEANPRLITVGDPSRAFIIAQLLDGAIVDPSKPGSLGPSVFVNTSGRGFMTFTGTFEGTPVSIVSIGMGAPMMDFFVRETRAIVDGPMAIIRFGSCGTLRPEDEIGCFVANTRSCMVNRNVDYFIDHSVPEPYSISKFVQASGVLHEALIHELSQSGHVYGEGINATCDSFYCSQGRIQDAFLDDNEGLLEKLHDELQVRTLDMETGHLFHLAESCRKDPKRPIFAAALKIILANRPKNLFILSDKEKHFLEREGGLICLRALKNFPLEKAL